jgi:hypothetical protein
MLDRIAGMLAETLFFATTSSVSTHATRQQTADASIA